MGFAFGSKQNFLLKHLCYVKANGIEFKMLNFNSFGCIVNTWLKIWIWFKRVKQKKSRQLKKLHSKSWIMKITIWMYLFSGIFWVCLIITAINIWLQTYGYLISPMKMRSFWEGKTYLKIITSLLIFQYTSLKGFDLSML